MAVDDADRDKVIQLVKSGAAKGGAEAISALRDAVPHLIEYNRLLAKVQREAYLAYLEQGFTQKQALELVKVVRV